MGKKQIKSKEKGKEEGYGVNNNLTPGGPGRPPGQKNYSTIYWEALEKLAESNDKSAEEIHLEILQKGILEARKGNYRFYKDVLDREHGTATQKTEIKGQLVPNNITVEFHDFTEETNDKAE